MRHRQQSELGNFGAALAYVIFVNLGASELRNIPSSTRSQCLVKFQRSKDYKIRWMYPRDTFPLLTCASVPVTLHGSAQRTTTRRRATFLLVSKKDHSSYLFVQSPGFATRHSALSREYFWISHFTLLRNQRCPFLNRAVANCLTGICV